MKILSRDSKYYNLSNTVFKLQDSNTNLPPAPQALLALCQFVFGSGQCDQEDVTDTQQGRLVPQAAVPLEVQTQEQMLPQQGEWILQQTQSTTAVMRFHGRCKLSTV
jgi:hypothetical protein